MKTNQKGFATITTIVMVLILILGSIIYFNKKTPTAVNSTGSNASGSDVNYVTTDSGSSDVASKTNVGIVITSIKPNDLVKLPITIEGYLDGKGWSANEGEIGVAEVFDANGKGISNLEIIRTTTDWMKFPTYFKAMVGDREKMGYIKTDTGVVKISANGAKDGEQIRSISIPVRFK